MKYIAPSLLSADFSNLAHQIRSVEIGGADWMHCDIMDGHYVPNLTFGPIVVKAIKKLSVLPLDCHLMIDNPDSSLEDFIESGASIITVHKEAVTHLNRTVKRIKDLGAKAGVAINPSTTISELRDIVEYVDMILILSVNPGFGGQTFIENSYRRITELANIRSQLSLDFLIEVDGGIDAANIKRISEAGCDAFVAGSAIFKNESISAATAELKNIVTSTFV